MTETPPEYDPVAALTTYVSAATGDREFVARQVSEAEALVSRLLTAGGTDPEPAGLPPELRQRAVLEVGADLFHRRAAKNGIQTFGTGPEVSPTRIRRDPLDAARPILFHWLPGGFA